MYSFSRHVCLCIVVYSSLVACLYLYHFIVLFSSKKLILSSESVIGRDLEVLFGLLILKLIWIFISLILYNNYFSISKEFHTCPDRVLSLSPE